MAKKKNTAAKANPTSSSPLKDETSNQNALVEVTKILADLGCNQGMVIGMKEDETILLNSTFPNYEQMHAILNRGQIELVIGHNRYIMNQIEAKKEAA